MVIGNGNYSSSPLSNPVNDATDLAANLEKLNFSVILRKNSSHQEMEEAIREFGEQLKKGGVGLFFYAGHGVQIGGRNYLLPVGVRINKETDVKFRSVDAEIILSEMSNAGNNLNIIILDACRDNPFGRKFRSVSRGLAIISDAPKGTFITYSTSPGHVAADGSGRNSPYTESLIHHMNTPGLPIEEVFKKVRQDISKKTNGQQVPWELSSLEGQFFFNPKMSKSSLSLSIDQDNQVDYEREKKIITEERERLRKEREIDEQRKALFEEKRRRAEEVEKLKALEEEATQRQIIEAEKAKLKRDKDLLEQKIAILREKRQLEEERARLEAEQVKEIGIWGSKKKNQESASAKAIREKALQDQRNASAKEERQLFDERAILLSRQQEVEANRITSGKKTDKVGASQATSSPTQLAIYRKDSDTANDLKNKLLLRSKPKNNLSEKEYTNFIRKNDIFDAKQNRNATSKNLFYNRGDGTIIDNTTGLMWQKDGSKYAYSWNEISQYIKELNQKKYAGYSDWRLPTIEELATLFKEKSQENKLFIDPYFSDAQYACWSADMEEDIQSGIYSRNYGEDARIWFASFEYGSAQIVVTSKDSRTGGGVSRTTSKEFYVKAVRSINY